MNKKLNLFEHLTLNLCYIDYFIIVINVRKSMDET